VSYSIATSGVWEYEPMRLFMSILDKNPDFQVIDVGANLGQFTLFAAKLGRTSIAIEPFFDNYIRLHMSAYLENLTDKIILIVNGVSEKRGERKQLTREDRNIGGQAIIDYDTSDMPVRDSKYSLVTIVLDDLIPIIPVNFTRAIMKIDIEGYEFKAFKSASELLKRVDIPVIFMEWLGKEDPDKYPDSEVEAFIFLMQKAGYKCVSNDGFDELYYKDHRIWPGDVLWVKESFLNNLMSITFK
jgi:FkbM family methyltransferase